jgi:hypothetical protein
MSCLLSLVEQRAYPYIIVIPPVVNKRPKRLNYSFSELESQQNRHWLSAKKLASNATV